MLFYTVPYEADPIQDKDAYFRFHYLITTMIEDNRSFEWALERAIRYRYGADKFAEDFGLIYDECESEEHTMECFRAFVFGKAQPKSRLWKNHGRKNKTEE